MARTVSKDKIPDHFGAYIGGARRDEWRIAGLRESDLEEMNEAEVKKWVKRDSVWPLPNAVKAVEAGEDAFIVYWARFVRRSTFAEPIRMFGTAEENAQSYVRELRELREQVEAVKTEADLVGFYEYIAKAIEEGRLYHCVSMRNLYATRYPYYLDRMKKKCEASGFPYTSKKKRKQGKTNFVPPQLAHIRREGEDYRKGKSVTPEFWQEVFNFRGVEFGNWTNQDDRQASLDYAFDALKDLAKLLNIEDKDIAFQGKLALAFGARGHSRAVAHYEPLRQVINLTKLRGAGSTAHEWFHALDNMLAEFCTITDEDLASESSQTQKLPKTFMKMIAALQFDENGRWTEFYRGSRAFDREHSKDGFGYWSSLCEMAARAFACYVKDMLESPSDYLAAHADCYLMEGKNGETIYAYPRGNERKRLNGLFDQLFQELIQIGFFTERAGSETIESVVNQGEANSPATSFCGLDFFYDEEGQMTLFG